MKILLDMYLNKNLGDDLFLKIITDRYKNQKFLIQPLCKYKKSELPNNVKVYRNFITRIINVIGKRIHVPFMVNYLKKKCDIYIILGGSMFIENDDLNYSKYIEKKYNLVKRPYYILGANFGPYKNNSFFKLYNKIFQDAKDVCFREKYSKNLFNNLKNVRYTSDMVFSLDTKNYCKKEKRYIVFSIIDLTKRDHLKKYTNIYEDKMIEMINYFQKNNFEIVLMSFCKYEGDEDAIQRLYQKCKKTDNIKIYNYDGNIEQSLNIIAGCSLVVASRFHATILGFLFGKKVLPLIYSSKTSNVLDDINFNGSRVYIENINNYILEDNIDKIKNLENIEKYKHEASKHFFVLDKEFDKYDY